jgi:hypothetical protein
MVSDLKEKDKYNAFFKKYKDVLLDDYSILNRTNIPCFTIFVSEETYHFDNFQLYLSNNGVHMIDGSFESNNPQYKISPLMSYDEFESYIEKHLFISKNMYKPKKFSRKI